MTQGHQEKACAWVEEFLGAQIVDCERQPRWRPAYFLTVEKDGDIRKYYFRGDRGVSESAIYALEHEMTCLQVLETEGIPVPHVFGFCPSPRGILMEHSPGRADLSTAHSDAEIRSVQRHYMEILARIHALDLEPFLQAGLSLPLDPKRLALADLPLWEKGFRSAKYQPEPLIEFGLRWLKQNLPPPGNSPSFVCGDSGQFLFEDGKVTAVLDLELAHLGDPAEDLGALRSRDLSEPLGDLKPAFEAYEEFVGHPVDRELVDYHTVRFALTTPLATVPVLATAKPGLDLIQYLCWNHVYSRATIEVIAHAEGVELLDPDLPADRRNRLSPLYDDLSLRLEPRPDQDEFHAYTANTAYRTAIYLRRQNDYGPALESADLVDVNSLLGSNFSKLDDADRALETSLENSGADSELLTLFYRRCVRREVLLEPILEEFSGARIQKLY